MAAGQFPFPLQPVTVPPEVARVEGCDCGGLEYHRDSCSIFALGSAERPAAVDAAQARLRDWTTGLNARLALHTGQPDSAVIRGGGGGHEAGGTPIEGSLRAAAAAGTWHAGLGAVDPAPGSDEAEMAAIVRECCRRVRPDLVGPADGDTFRVTSAVTGRRYRVTVTEES